MNLSGFPCEGRYQTRMTSKASSAGLIFAKIFRHFIIGIFFMLQTRISKKAKRISITVKRDGEILLVVPYRKTSILQNLLIKKAEVFLKKKESWIVAQKTRIEARAKQRKDASENREASLAIRFSKNIQTRSELKIYIESRIKHFRTIYSGQYGLDIFTFRNIFIKNTKTRWGSCSKRGNLNFSVRLTSLTERECDYVIVHELCHLKEFNHSPNFWKLVAVGIPEYKELRASMRWVE